MKKEKPVYCTSVELQKDNMWLDKGRKQSALCCIGNYVGLQRKIRLSEHGGVQSVCPRGSYKSVVEECP
jgi:hypothetical protein